MCWWWFVVVAVVVWLVSLLVKCASRPFMDGFVVVASSLSGTDGGPGSCCGCSPVILVVVVVVALSGGFAGLLGLPLLLLLGRAPSIGIDRSGPVKGGGPHRTN